MTDQLHDDLAKALREAWERMIFAANIGKSEGDRIVRDVDSALAAYDQRKSAESGTTHSEWRFPADVAASLAEY